MTRFTTRSGQPVPFDHRDFYAVIFRFCRCLPMIEWVLYSPFKFQVEAYFLFLPVRANCVCFHLCKSNSHFDLNIYHIDYNFLKFLNFSLIIMDSWTLTLFEFSICHSICIEIIFEINLFIRDINIFPLVEISFVSTRIKNRISERIFLSIANRLVAY